MVVFWLIPAAMYYFSVVRPRERQVKVVDLKRNRSVGQRMSDPARPRLSKEGVTTTDSLVTSTPRTSDALRATDTLAVFDLDGTLIVSKGREVVTTADGLRACLHPLMEHSCQSALPAGCASDFACCGEEDQHGDPYQLLHNATLIRPIADRLRALLDRPANECEVAILTARGHDPTWLASTLTRKLQLRRPLRPDLVHPVYSPAFEAAMTATTGRLGRTAERKAFAIGRMIELVRPSDVHFWDDLPSNVDAVTTIMQAEHADLDYHPHLVPLECSLKACEEAGVDVREICHFQCRDEAGAPPNSLVQSLLATPIAAQIGLPHYQRPTTKAKLPP